MDNFSPWYFVVLIFVVHILLQFVWTIIIQTFPKILGDTLVKRIQHEYDVKLEKVRGDTQASIATMQSSVDYLSSVQAELRSEVIESAVYLWNAALAIQKEFSDVVGLHSWVLPEEIDSYLKTGQGDPLLAVEDYRNIEGLNAKMDRISSLHTEERRLFVGDRLWLIFFVFRAFHGRLGYKMHLSFEKKNYNDWREDDFMLNQLRTVLDVDVIEKAKREPFSGIQLVVSHLEFEFLREATRVMSGSLALADSLSDIRDVLQYKVQSAEEMPTMRKNTTPGK